MSDFNIGNLTSVSADLLESPSRTSSLIIKSVAAGISLAVLWSYLTPVVEVTAGTGKVVPDRFVQSIQSLEGGYVDAIFAKNGDHVEKGDVILRLDPVPSGTTREEVAQQMAGLEAKSTRLRALLSNKKPDFSDTLVKSHPKIVAVELSQYETDKAEFETSIQTIALQAKQKKSELAEAKSELKTINKALHLAAEEYAVLQSLEKDQAASRAEVMTAEAKQNELQGSKSRLTLALVRLEAAAEEYAVRAEERSNNFRSRIASELNESENKLASFSASLMGQQHRVTRTEVRAPVSGTLKTVSAINVGQVIKPYDIVAEVVPTSETVLIQARVRPEDIAFVATGLPTVIKLSAYDYSIFGSLKGKLERIAADSNTDEKGGVYYVVDVRADKNYIERRGERWPIKPGMVANVEIQTGTRTVFQYLTKPIHRMTTMALRER